MPLSAKFVASSPLEKLSPAGARSMHYTELSQSILGRDQKEKSLRGEGSVDMSKPAWNSMDDHPKSLSSLSFQPASHSLGRIRADFSGTQWESSLFSSSLSEIFSRKSKLPFRRVFYCLCSLCVLMLLAIISDVL